MKPSRPLQQFAYGICGISSAIRKVIQKIRMLASYPYVCVLIDGPTGSGKELVARALHLATFDKDSRIVCENGPNFIPVNCAILSPQFILSQLFGHVRGAFTGAEAKMEGLVSCTRDGTLFFDELNSFPLEVQPMLLRFLDSDDEGRRVYRALGSTAHLTTSARIVSAINVPLASIRGLAVRADILSRLCEERIRVPGLDERKEDIPILVLYLLEKMCKGGLMPSVDKSAVDYLVKQHWPGNVRQLKTVLRRAYIRSSISITEKDVVNAYESDEDGLLDEGFVPLILPHSLLPVVNVIPLEILERNQILRAMEETRGNISKAADLLRIHRTTLWRKLKSYSPRDIPHFSDSEKQLFRG